jgi:hypothetical protein
VDRPSSVELPSGKRLSITPRTSAVCRSTFQRNGKWN